MSYSRHIEKSRMSITISWYSTEKENNTNGFVFGSLCLRESSGGGDFPAFKPLYRKHLTHREVWEFLHSQCVNMSSDDRNVDISS